MVSTFPFWFPEAGQPLDSAGPLPATNPFSRIEARAEGCGDRVLRQLIARGAIRRVLKGVFVSTEMADSLELRAKALMLVVPPSAVVTDRTAAWLHGVAILPRSSAADLPPVQVFQRSGTRVRRAEVAGGTRGLLDRDVTVISGVQVTTKLRTALDLGRLLWRFDALAALDGFARLGVTTKQLHVETDRFRGFRGVTQLRTLTPLADARSESPGESALRLHWYEAGLPRPELQWWVHDDDGNPVYRLDIALPDLMLCAEYDGVQFHTEFQQTSQDVRRRAWLNRERGWRVEVFRKDDVYGPALHAGPRLEAAYRLATGSSWN